MIANLNRTYIVGFRRMPLRFEGARYRHDIGYRALEQHKQAVGA